MLNLLLNKLNLFSHLKSHSGQVSLDVIFMVSMLFSFLQEIYYNFSTEEERLSSWKVISGSYLYESRT